MPPHDPARRAALLAALQLQYEWGAVDVIEEAQWDALSTDRDISTERALVDVAPGRVTQGRAAQGKTVQEKATQRRAVPEDGERRVPKTPTAARLPEGATAAALCDAPDLPALIRLSEAVDGVGLARTATHRLAPICGEDAPFMVIGETPDADEDRSGQLWQGRAGALFERMLGAIGVARADLSMAPAIPWRPPGGRSVTDVEMRDCLPILQRSIALCRPPRLVTLGTTPARMLLGEGAVLSRVRGKWLEVEIPGCANRVPLLAMNHPLQLSVSPAIRRNVWHDLLLLASSLDGN